MPLLQGWTCQIVGAVVLRKLECSLVSAGVSPLPEADSGLCPAAGQLADVPSCHLHMDTQAMAP